MGEPLKITRINDRIIEFTETAVDAYLILGDRRALLVDALMNETGLVGAVREITDLPVDVVITHGHGDHAGLEVKNLRAAGWDVYLAPVDVDLLTGMFGRPEAERGWYKPLHDGDVFDLGGVRLEAILVPGHTPGSCVLYEPERLWLFTGDTVGSGAFWMQIPGCVPLHEFADNLDRLIARVSTDDALLIYPGHRYQSPVQLTGRYLADVRHITRGILAGELVGSEESYPVGNFEVHCRVVRYGLMPNGYSYNPENL